MYGRRFRIGLIVPSSNTTMGPEFYRMTPEGVSVHTARMRFVEATPEALRKMADDALKAAEDLATAEPDVMIYGCTTGALLGRASWERELVGTIRRDTGIKVITTAMAVIKALKSLKVGKVAVATPYTDKLNDLEEAFLRKHGIEAVSIRGLGIIRNIEIGEKSPQTAYRLAKEVFKPEANGIFISCTNFRTIEIIEKLERELGRSVVTSNQASMWSALRLIREPVKGYGRLLRALG